MWKVQSNWGKLLASECSSFVVAFLPTEAISFRIGAPQFRSPIGVVCSSSQCREWRHSLLIGPFHFIIGSVSQFNACGGTVEAPDCPHTSESCGQCGNGSPFKDRSLLLVIICPITSAPALSQVGTAFVLATGYQVPLSTSGLTLLSRLLMPSCSVVPPLPSPSPNPRKRTTSFFEPLPRKTSRTMLRRTESFLSLSDYNDESHSEGGSFLHMSSTPTPSSRIAPLHHARQHYKEQRERDTARLGRKRAQFTIAPTSSPSGASLPKRGAHVVPKQFQPAVPHVRTTSPLAPSRKLLPPRASFPRSKPEPDLYRMALKTRMRSSPEGEKILRMGPRLAIAILSATRELERIVSAHEDDDVMMGDETEPSTRSARWDLGRDMMAVPCGA